MNQDIELVAEISEEASKLILDNSYMDDIAGSVSTVAEAECVTNDITTILDAGGFKIKKWFISKKDKQSEAETKAEANVIEKVLGMLWDTEKDVLYFNRK